MDKRGGNHTGSIQTLYWMVITGMYKRNLFYFGLIGCIFLFSGCVSGNLTRARQSYYNQNPDAALAELTDPGAASGRNQLVFSLEKGLILHDAKRYEESAEAFRHAASIMEAQEVIRLGQQSASLVTNDWVTDYKGEYSERLWVHTYLMMNYLILYRYESALVEAKKALKVLEKHPSSLEYTYFTRALIALCFENLKEYDGARIEYEKMARSASRDSPAAVELVRISRMTGHPLPEGISPSVSEHPLARNARTTELVIFLGVGRGPVKEADDIVAPPSVRISFPRYVHRFTRNVNIFPEKKSQRMPFILFQTDMNQVAGMALEERSKEVIAKAAARAAFKEGIAQAVGGKNDELVTALVRTVLFLTEEADTRGWETLPARLLLIRIPVSPGTHNDIALSVSTGYGPAVVMHTDPFLIRKNQRIYRCFRINPN